MKENKTEQEHIKIYDKEMYVSQEKLKNVFLIIVAFLIGFVAGYFSKDVNNVNPETPEESSYNVNITE